MIMLHREDTLWGYSCTEVMGSQVEWCVHVNVKDCQNAIPPTPTGCVCGSGD